MRKIGNGYGVLLPKQLMEEMSLMEGAMLEAEQNAGVLTLKPADDEFTVNWRRFLRTEPQHRNSYREWRSEACGTSHSAATLAASLPRAILRTILSRMEISERLWRPW